MTKRIYSTEHVLGTMLSDEEDFDEPMMAGSDDEFLDMPDDDVDDH